MGYDFPERNDTMAKPFEGDKEKLAKMNTKQRFDYIWGYYKFGFIGVAIGIIIIFSLIQTVRANNPDAISIFIADMYNEDSESAHTWLNDAFKKRLSFDEAAKDPIVFDNTISLTGDDSTMAMASVQKLMAVVMSGNMELMITSVDSITLYGEQGMFMNLEEVLPEDLFNELKDEGLLFTVTLLPSEDETMSEDKTPSENNTGETYYGGIRLDGNAMLESAGYHTEGSAIGFVSNSSKQEVALEFVKMILEK